MIVFIKEVPSVNLKNCVTQEHFDNAILSANRFRAKESKIDRVKDCLYKWNGEDYWVKTTKTGNLTVRLLNTPYL